MKTRLLLAFVLITVLLVSFAPSAQASDCDPVWHRVKPGEYLARIASYYGVTVQSIVNANNLWNPNLIYVGQLLRIPVTCAPPPPSACTTVHVVKAGEYLKLIAARYKTTVTAIVNLNGITNPNLIYPGQRLLVPVACPKPKPKPTVAPTPPQPTGPWTGRYWDNRFFSGEPKLVRRDQKVDFSFGTAGPGGGIAGTTFSVRWTRSRYFEPGSYRFRILVDDGVRLWIDGALLIDQWHDSAPTEYVAVSQLSAGNHNIQIDYYQNTGSARIWFMIEPLDVAMAWKAEYWNNPRLEGAPSVTRQVNAVDFDFGLKVPVTGITADYFSDRYTGTFHFVGGKYRFTAVADDGIRVWVDDNLIIDQWRVTSVVAYQVDIDVSEGNHNIKVEHFEQTGSAVVKLRWTQR
ncbi:MAG: PA14 domain-containing protein [Anaerolineae bacterium]|nr:PA14 domain-containing protein [Anaerolineae bacterium]